MTYKRIVGLVLIDHGIVCRTRNFQIDYKYIDAHIDTTFFDEMCFIDVTRQKTDETNEVFMNTVNRLMSNSQLPVCIGSSINSSKDVRRLRRFGADRYLINQTDSNKDKLVLECIEEFGKSSIISSINHRGMNLYTKQSYSTNNILNRIAEITDFCGSEVLINSVDKDGTLTGMDLETINAISQLDTPSLIISGGLGRYEHALEMMSIPSVSAVCTSNIYHLTTKTISSWRQRIRSLGGNVRDV